jgi:uncharacterized protein
MQSRQQQIEILAGNGNLKALKDLFERAYTQWELNTALENAIAYSQLEIADYLLVLGADFSYGNYQGVYYAVHNNELEGLKYAIAKGVSINTQAGMILNESIFTAINTKSTEILKWVLENGADTKFLTQNSREIIDKYGTEDLKSLLFQ